MHDVVLQGVGVGLHGAGGGLQRNGFLWREPARALAWKYKLSGCFIFVGKGDNWTRFISPNITMRHNPSNNLICCVIVLLFW